MKEKILVIGGSELQVPLINKVKSKGFHCGVIDYDKNAAGIKFADDYFNVSTTDEVGVYEVAKQYKPSAIVTTATDMPMRSIAYSCEKLGLRSISYDTSIKATDKFEMIKALEEFGVPHPYYRIIRENDDLQAIALEIKYPCVSKPVDSSGSRGVALIKEAADFEKIIDYSLKSSRSKKVIIEEYLVGQEVSVEIICQNGVITPVAVTKKYTTGAPHFIEIAHVQPAGLEEKVTKELVSVAKSACNAIGIIDGVAHVEIMVTNEGPKVIELGARLGGDYITSHLVPLSTGIDIIWAMVQIALGEPLNLPEFNNNGVAIKFLGAEYKEIISQLDFDKISSEYNIVEYHFDYSKTLKTSDFQSSNDRFGHIIAKGNTGEIALNNIDQLLKECY